MCLTPIPIAAKTHSSACCRRGFFYRYVTLPTQNSTGVPSALLEDSRSASQQWRKLCPSLAIQNNRPVSLLSFPSKALKRAVSNEISLCLSQNNLLDHFQSGFQGFSLYWDISPCCNWGPLNCQGFILLLFLLSHLCAAFNEVHSQFFLSILCPPINHMCGFGRNMNWGSRSVTTYRGGQTDWQQCVSRSSVMRIQMSVTSWCDEPSLQQHLSPIRDRYVVLGRWS